MVDLFWEHVSPLLNATRLNGGSGKAGVFLSEIRGPNVMQIMTRRGKQAEMANIIKSHLGLEPPGVQWTTASPHLTLIWSGPDQFLALTLDSPAWQEIKSLQKCLDQSASLSEQSHGRCWMRMSGPRVREMLAKVLSLDLDPSVFPVGRAAATSVEHTAANLWRGADEIDGLAVFNMLVFTSFAASIWRAIGEASGEYGLVTQSIGRIVKDGRLPGV